MVTFEGFHKWFMANWGKKLTLEIVETFPITGKNKVLYLSQDGTFKFWHVDEYIDLGGGGLVDLSGLTTDDLDEGLANFYSTEQEKNKLSNLPLDTNEVFVTVFQAIEDALTLINALDFKNGLIKTGDEIEIGGPITKNTVLQGNNLSLFLRMLGTGDIFSALDIYASQVLLYWKNGAKSNAFFARSDGAFMQAVNPVGNTAALVYAEDDGFVRVGNNGFSTNFFGLKYRANYIGINWSEDELLIPHQKRVLELISSSFTSFFDLVEFTNGIKKTDNVVELEDVISGKRTLENGDTYISLKEDMLFPENPPLIYRQQDHDVKNIIYNEGYFYVDYQVNWDASGDFYDGNPIPSSGILRLNFDGSLDAEFSLTFDYSYQFKFFKDYLGNLFIIGGFEVVNGHNTQGVVKLNAQGIVDTTFTINGYPEKYCLFDGKVIFFRFGNNGNINGLTVDKHLVYDIETGVYSTPYNFIDNLPEINIDYSFTDQDGSILLCGYFGSGQILKILPDQSHVLYDLSSSINDLSGVWFIHPIDNNRYLLGTMVADNQSQSMMYKMKVLNNDFTVNESESENQNINDSNFYIFNNEEFVRILKTGQLFIGNIGTYKDVDFYGNLVINTDLTYAQDKQFLDYELNEPVGCLYEFTDGYTIFSKYGYLFLSESQTFEGHPFHLKTNATLNNDWEIIDESDPMFEDISGGHEYFIETTKIKYPASIVELNSYQDDDLVPAKFIRLLQVFAQGTDNEFTAEDVKNKADLTEVEKIEGIDRVITVTNANRTESISLNPGERRIKIILSSTLTNDWAPVDITGWRETYNYEFYIEKLSNNGIILSHIPRVYFDQGIDPFINLFNIKIGQMAIIDARGLKRGVQFSGFITTDEKYIPPVFSSVFSNVFNK